MEPIITPAKPTRVAKTLIKTVTVTDGDQLIVHDDSKFTGDVAAKTVRARKPKPKPAAPLGSDAKRGTEGSAGGLAPAIEPVPTALANEVGPRAVAPVAKGKTQRTYTVEIPIPRERRAGHPASAASREAMAEAMRLRKDEKLSLQESLKRGWANVRAKTAQSAK